MPTLSLRERERAVWLRPSRGHAELHRSATEAGVRTIPWAEREHTTESKSALKQLVLFCVALALWIAPGLLLMQFDLHAVEAILGANPLQHTLTSTLVLAFALGYIVATGLLIAATASSLTEGRPLYVRSFLLFVVAPAIFLSLISTLLSSLAFFFSLLIWCFPSLL